MEPGACCAKQVFCRTEIEPSLHLSWLMIEAWYEVCNIMRVVMGIEFCWLILYPYMFVFFAGGGRGGGRITWSKQQIYQISWQLTNLFRSMPSPESFYITTCNFSFASTSAFSARCWCRKLSFCFVCVKVALQSIFLPDKKSSRNNIRNLVTLPGVFRELLQEVCVWLQHVCFVSCRFAMWFERIVTKSLCFAYDLNLPRGARIYGLINLLLPMLTIIFLSQSSGQWLNQFRSIFQYKWDLYRDWNKSRNGSTACGPEVYTCCQHKCFWSSELNASPASDNIFADIWNVATPFTPA